MRLSEESSAWVTLTRAPALDVRSLNRALEIFGSAQGFIQASDASREHAGMPAAARKFLTSAQAVLSLAERAWLENPRHHVVPYTDPTTRSCCARRGVIRSHCMSPAMWRS